MANIFKRLFFALAISGLFFLALRPDQAHAANFHIRVGAVGSNSGADWTNAWTGFSSISWASVNPGDTLYIAAGTYAGVTVPESGTVSARITFKRATIAVHGSGTGWNNAYDGQVIMDGAGAQGVINIGDQHDLTFDGATRYGIRIVDGFHGVRGTAGNNNDNLTLRYLEIGGTGADKMDEDGVQGSGSNFLMEYCWIHDNDDLTNHGDGVQWYEADVMTVRYNLFQNNGQVMMLTENAFGPTQLVNDLDFSYNVIANRSGAHYNGLSKKFCPAAGRFWNIYNNTWDAFLDQGTNFEDDILGGAGSCTLMFFRNNAFIRTRMNSMASTTHNNNGYDNTDPLAVYNGNSIAVPTETGRVSTADLGFTDVTGIDYHLLSGSALINAGTNVGLSQDFDGNPILGNPDIGAFEFGATPPPPPPPPPGPVRAFPGAEGVGANSIGGRGGRVIEVTNLNNAGVGSFRDAVTQSGPRTVVFRVGGTIILTSPIRITSSYLTIAGQTAPGGGIQIRGNQIGIYDLAGQPMHDVIVRYIRHRRGWSSSGVGENAKGFEIVSEAGTSIYNVILDHVSLGWQQDDTGIWGAFGPAGVMGTRDITIQRSIFAEANNPSPTVFSGYAGKGAMIGVPPGQGHRMGPVSFHHNFITSNFMRNPMMGGDGPVNFVNNVIYNWEAFGTEMQSKSANGEKVNFIGNTWKKGPTTNARYEILITAPRSDVSAQIAQMVYTFDNFGPHRTSSTQPQWAVVGDYGPSDGLAPASTFYQRSTPWIFSGVPITISAAQSNVNGVLNDVGAMLPARDAVDTRLVAEYFAGTGTVGGDNNWPSLSAGTAPADGDHDGMPDSFETANGLSPSNPNDGNSIHSSGYTWLEAYLNGTPTSAVAPVVSITSPVQNATVSGSSVSLTANATDDEGVLGVQFKLDGVNLGAEDTASPYAVTWNTTLAVDGGHTLTAVARDADSNSTTSLAVNVTVNNNVTTTIGETSVLGTNDDPPPNTQQWLLYNLVSSSTIQSFSVYVVSGSGNIRMGIYDTSGASGKPGVLKAQTAGFAPATGWQTQAVQTPVTLAPGNYWISFIINGSLTLSASPTGGTGWAKPTAYGPMPTPNPAPTVSGTWQWSFYGSLAPAVDNTAPTVNMTAPPAGNVTGASVSLTANAFDVVGVVGVQFKLDAATNIGAEDLTFPYGVTWDTTLVATGPHTLSAVARDAASNTATSASVAVTVVTATTAEQDCIALGGTYVTGSISPPTLCVDELP